MTQQTPRRAGHLQIARSPDVSDPGRPSITWQAGGRHSVSAQGPPSPYVGSRRAPDPIEGRFFNDPEAPVNHEEACLLMSNVLRLLQRRNNDITSPELVIRPERVPRSSLQCPQYDRLRPLEPAAGARWEENEDGAQVDLAIRAREPGSPHYKVSMLSFFQSGMTGYLLSESGSKHVEYPTHTMRVSSRILTLGNGDYEEVDYDYTSEPVTTHQARAVFNLMRDAVGFPPGDFPKIPPVAPHELPRAFRLMELPLAEPYTAGNV